MTVHENIIRTNVFLQKEKKPIDKNMSVDVM